MTLGRGIDGLDQSAATRAVINNIGDWKARAAALFEAGKFRWHEDLL
jgi:hypothetical protein